MWIRVRSKRTGHQWDAAPETAAVLIAAGAVEACRPARDTVHPRPAKPLRDLAGRPATPRPRHHARKAPQ